MVRPNEKSALSCASWLCPRAMARAATSIAAFSRNPPARSSDASRERTSRSSVSSPAHADRRNASRSSGARSSADCRTSLTCFHRSESIVSPASQFAVEPSLGRPPVALHGNSRYFEHLGSLFDAESANAPNDNPPDEFIANLQNSPDGKWLKISADQNAAITVSNARTGESKTYKRN